MKRIVKLLLAFVVACSCFVGWQPVEAGMISLEQEIKMGRETAQALEAKYGLSQDYYLNERVDKMLCAVATISNILLRCSTLMRSMPSPVPVDLSMSLKDSWITCPQIQSWPVF